MVYRNRIGGIFMSNSLYTIYGGKAFVNVKNALEIDKICLSFVSKENKKNFIDIYMDATEFGGVLMRYINNGVLLKKLLAEKEKGDKYSAAIWNSKLGGSNSNGQTIARNFTIAPGASQDVVITAYSYPADEIDGKFVPKKGVKPLLTIRVGCSFEELLELQYCWSFLEKDYMPKRYNMTALKDTYRNGENTQESRNSATPRTNSVSGTNASKSGTETQKKENKPKTSESNFVSETNVSEPINNAKKDTFDNSSLVKYTVLSKTPVNSRRKNPEDYSMCATNSDGIILNIIIPKEAIKKMKDNEWKNFVDSCNADEDPTKFTFFGTPGIEDTYDVVYFSHFAP